MSPDRHLAGTLAEQQLGCTVHVLDDGFQHLELARDLDVLVTTIGEIPNGRVIPIGRLREPIDAAARAHVLVVSDATAGAAAAEAWALGISQSCGALRILGAPVAIGRDHRRSLGDSRSRDRRLEGSRKCSPSPASRNPERFFDALKNAGWNVVDSIAFPDHHRYTAKDIAAIDAKLQSVRRRRRCSRPTRTRSGFEALGRCRLPLYRVPLVVQFDPPDALFQSVIACRHRRATAGRVRDAIEYWSVVAVRAVARRLPEAAGERVGRGASG